MNPWKGHTPSFSLTTTRSGKKREYSPIVNFDYDIIGPNAMCDVKKHMRLRGRRRPPNPREPVPSVPLIGKAEETSLRYGGLRGSFGVAHLLLLYLLRS